MRAQSRQLTHSAWPRVAHAAPRAEIWTALHAAVDSDADTARVILDAAGVSVPGSDLSCAYDERGWLYELPPFVLSAPVNLVR